MAALLALSTLVVGAAGGFLVAHAWGLPYPDPPAFAEKAGRVVALRAERCGPRTRPGTCFRPIVDYPVEGATLQTAARSRYRPAPFQVGDSVPVLLGNDGSVWLKPEWDARDAAERRDVRGRKTMFVVLGSLTLGAALFGAVLVAALLVMKDKGPGAPP